MSGNPSYTHADYARIHVAPSIRTHHNQPLRVLGKPIMLSLLSEAWRKTIGVISTIIGSLMIFYVVADSYTRDFLRLGTFLNLVQRLPELAIGMILVIIGYLLYPTEYARELIEDTFHFDEDGNLQ